MNIKIIADSTSDLPQEFIEKYNIDILPLHIILNEESFDDGININTEELFKWSNDNNLTPKTAGISLLEASEAFKKYLNEYDYILCFTISSPLSSTYNNLRVASKEVNEERIYVVDTKSLCIAIGLLIIKATKMIEEGKDIKEIFDELNSLKDKLHTSFVVDSLEYLHRGGRCSDAALLLGNALKVHPMIVMKDGKLEADKKYRGNMKHVIHNYINDLKDSLNNADKELLAIAYSGDRPDNLDEIKAELKKEYGFKEILETKAGCVISSHCGPNTFAIFFIEN